MAERLTERYAVYERPLARPMRHWTFVAAATDSREAETIRLDVVDRYEAQRQLRETLIVEGPARRVKALPPVMTDRTLFAARLFWTKFAARPLTAPLPWDGELP